MSEKTDRRGFLSKTAAAAAGLGAALSMEERILLAAMDDGTVAAEKPAPAAEPMPYGKIGKTTISRLIMGGNLIGGWAHSRDLLYTSRLFRAYNTEAKIFETLELGEQHGINTIQIDPVSIGVVNKYRRERKSKLQTIVCARLIPETIEKTAMRDHLKGLIDAGATMLYTHGMDTEKLLHNGQFDIVARALDIIKEQGYLAGIGGHSLQTPILSEKNKLPVDYYVKTLHIDRYWSATPKEHRREWCWYDDRPMDHDDYCDNIFCIDPEETVAFMEKVAKPWIAFKVMAAGAIPPRVGIPHAFRHGADFVIAGMFDFQVGEDVRIALEALRKTKSLRSALAGVSAAIASILDNDLYKFTMQQAVLELYPEATATYEFIDRREADHFDQQFLQALREAIGQLAELRLQPDEREFLRRRCPALKPAYLERLQDCRFDPREVDARLDSQGRLSIAVAGAWHRTILWEVPLLAIVSELHGRLLDVGWSRQGQEERLREKSRTLLRAGCRFADFGTRRRRDFQTQDLAVRVLRDNPGFLGTSNVLLARRYDAPAVGTMGHEWIMAHGALCSLRHANRFALEAWARVYPDKPGTALTDTYTTAAFFADFDAPLARLYNSLRQDSGSPLDFVDRAVEHYRKLGIDPASKTIVFSDGLTPESAARIRQYCEGRIAAAFGIGTNLTNDFPGFEPLNIVIKLTELNGRPVAKLTDDPGKASGRADALEAARRTFLGG